MAHEGVSHTVFVTGFIKGYARKAMNIQDITHHPSKHIIEQRLKVMQFYDDYGEQATERAFGVSRSTIFLWKQKLRANQGRLSSLAPRSRAPHHRRSRTTDPRIAGFLVSQREAHPQLGKDKLHELLRSFCAAQELACPSVSTVGRILGDLKAQGRLPRHAKLSVFARTGRMYPNHMRHTTITKARRGDYYPSMPGDLVQIDCVVKFINGMRRYVVSAIDYRSEFAFSLAYSSLSSARAKDFLDRFIQVAPFTVTRVQTDNGSEFYKLFHESCVARGLTHYWNYPRSPRMNAKIERYNRSIQEEFIDYHLDDLAYGLPDFNHQLMDWLLWYNTERPHWTLKLKSPMHYLLELLQLPAAESSMLWTDTATRQISKAVVA